MTALDGDLASPDALADVVAALRAHRAPVRYTEYAGLGHNVWDPAFADPALPAWLFSQRRA